MKKKTSGTQLFAIFNSVFLIFMALICILPMINVLAISFSSQAAATAGLVKLWPVDFTLSSYKYVLAKQEFLTSMFVSIKRLLLGVFANTILTILVSYPLSKEKNVFRSRSIYTWFFMITILFNGGLVPTYMALNSYGLIDSIWALILPTAVPVFNIVVLMNFFRQLPKEIEEAALIDGANHWLIMIRLFVPLSIPAIATLILFSAVFHWNSWFDGLLYMNNPAHYPLQSYLQTVIISRDITMVNSTTMKELSKISDRTAKAAQIFVGAIPILLVYPLLQKYFTTGIVLGSVKG